jgi:regulator of sigma E protease
MATFLLVLGVVLIILLIVSHEFGHFIVARRNGVDVEEFGIFFGPKLFKRKTKGGWDFTVRLIPLGGFVRLKGEHDSDTESGSFGAATTWAKTKIMAAGVTVNLVTALVLFTIVALIGMPKLINNQYTVKSDTQLAAQNVLVTYVQPGSPAARAGLQAQDELNDFALSGYSPVGITTSAQLLNSTKDFAGKTVNVYFTRAGHNHIARTTFLSNQVVANSRKTNDPKGYLGVESTDFTLQRSTWSAPVVAVGLSAQLIGLTFQGIGHALGGLGSLIAGGATGNTTARQHGQTSASSQVGGPISIFELLKGSSLLGYQLVLFIVAYIALILAFMNFLPFPALDGGRLWLTLLSRAVFKRPLSNAVEERANLAGALVLISLMLLITIVDVKRYF